MEVYILDSLYRRIDVVDKYESLIWTERFSSIGDFELIVHSTIQNRARFVPGVRLAHNESVRVMTVETVSDDTDEQGKRILKVTGPSLEGILEHRLAIVTLDDLDPEDSKWIFTDTPKAIVEGLFHWTCIEDTVDDGDILPVIEDNVLFPEDTIGEPTEEITYSIEPMSLYKAMKDLADVYSMGFRIVRHPETNLLYFDVYMGSDRTTDQSTLDAIVFSPDLENLKNTSKLTTMALYKNVAYVFSPVGREDVFPPDVDDTVEGFERRALFVRADDITDPDPPTASAQMIQRGKEELAKNRRITALDGELAQTTQYVYGVHYHLGDLVELRDDDGATSQMQVTEQIFVSDAQGERKYPTLSINLFITPGSWLAWDFAQEWDDLTTEEWEDLP
jgi:hypothetical protein